MRVLIGCEFSGIVRDEFAKRGHDAWSCDLLPTELSGKHYRQPVEEIISKRWDLMIAHPPCTHLAVSGARWFKKKQKEQEEALNFISKTIRENKDIKFFLLNLPPGCGKSFLAMMIIDYYKKNINNFAKFDIITNNKLLQGQEKLKCKK